jgi:lipopolysaccharide/colanic/teichoic acid biosynthesis glycosyltransferase
MMKRIIDIAVSLIAILLLSPVLVIVAMVIYSTDKGDIFFRQRRVGFDGRIFEIYKFRSMVVNAEQLGGYSTADSDPRITSVGKWIRRTSLDELPQLLNVLLGDMSLVGPRPDVPAQMSLYTEDEWRLRNSVRPGITGLAQATLRSEATMEQRKMMDLQYVKDVSILTDMKIILMTVKQVFGRGGN